MMTTREAADQRAALREILRLAEYGTVYDITVARASLLRIQRVALDVLPLEGLTAPIGHFPMQRMEDRGWGAACGMTDVVLAGEAQDVTCHACRQCMA